MMRKLKALGLVAARDPRRSFWTYRSAIRRTLPFANYTIDVASST
jgi:hypothetical protein